MKTLKRALCCLTIFSVVGCGGATVKPEGTETVVSSTGNKGEWINTVPDNKGNIMYWVGRSTGADDARGALTDAREECNAQIVNYLGTFNNKLYEYARVQRASNADTGRLKPYINDLVQSYKRKVLTSGMRQKKVYTEKVERVRSAGRVAYHYNAYVLMESNKKQLSAMRDEAFAEQIKKAQQSNDQESAKQLENMSNKLRNMEQ